MNFFQNMWNNIDELQKTSETLQWGSFILIFIGLILGISKYLVDKREQVISKEVKDEKDVKINYFRRFWNNSNSLQRISKILQLIPFIIIFVGLILGVTKYFVDKREKILSKIVADSKVSTLGQKENVYKQLIRTATATVEVIINSSDTMNTTYMDVGGFIAFAKGKDAILLMSSTSCTGRQLGGNKVMYKGIFNLDATSKVTNERILYLKQSEYAQIFFKPMLAKRDVLGGKAIVTINNLVRIEILVPPQVMSKEFIIIPNVQKYLTEFIE